MRWACLRDGQNESGSSFKEPVSVWYEVFAVSSSWLLPAVTAI